LTIDVSAATHKFRRRNGGIAADIYPTGACGEVKEYGFSERSGIKVNLESPSDRRLPRAVAVPLFRILQASLSNVHWHSGSLSVDVQLSIDETEARLEVKDYGKGIDP
jgi:signal transduction histidine kinase